MSPLKIDVKKFANTHKHYEHIWFSEFCNAFELGSEVYANHFRVKKILGIA